MTDPALSADESASPPPLDLRVARVAQAREHPNADRLLLLQVDLGRDERQVVAGLVGHYEPAELEGRHVVVVANIAEARLRGEVSQGMVLACENEDGRLGLLLADGADPGTRLRPTDAPAPAESTERISIDDFAAHEFRAGDDGVRLDGAPLEGAELRVDRDVRGRIR